MFKKILILIIIFSQISFAEIRLNEIMANPEYDEDLNEWIEIYNNGTNSVDIKDYKINDKLINGGKENGAGAIIPPGYFGIISDSETRIYDNFEFGDKIIRLYLDGNLVLTNAGKEIILYNNNGNQIDKVDYPELSDGESYSFINNFWSKTEPTPGKANDVETKILDYSTVKINEFLPDPVGEDNAAMPNGEWVELYNSGDDNLDLLGFQFYDNEGDNADVIITDTTTDKGTIIKKEGYLIVYTNGVSSFLNNNGFEKIKLYGLNNNLIDEVSYEGSKEGISWSKINNIWQYGLPTPNSINKGNESIEDSSIKITKIYDEDNKWGDIIKIKFDIYKADTAKNSIKIYVENENNKKVSEETSMNIYGKFSDYNLILPVKLLDNCDGKFNNSEYELIVEGLDTKDSEKIKIEGNNCKIIERNETIINKENILKDEPKIVENKNIESETVIYHKNGVLYQSKGNEASRYALFFMTGISILLLLHYIQKK